MRILPVDFYFPAIMRMSVLPLAALLQIGHMRIMPQIIIRSIRVTAQTFKNHQNIRINGSQRF